MKKKIATILTTALILSMIPVNVYAEDVSGNEIPEITETASETPETVTEDPETEVTEIAEPVMTQEPEDIPEISLDGTPVTSEEVEELTEEEFMEMLTLSGVNEGSADFIERLYNVALGRASEAKGKQDWLNALNEGATGADLARGFLYSAEFLNKGTSNEEFLNVLYSTFFDRAADAEGMNGWLKALNEGYTRQQIVDGFIGSQEYSNLCATYRIDPGTGVIPNVDIEPTEETLGFATRLYSTCLGRTPDAKGLNDWAKALASQQASGTKVAEGFFFSDEFVSSNISDAEYILRLYKTFFNREPDREGLDGWTTALRDGYSRKYVFNGFANSDEWKQVCRQYEIVSGTPSELTASDYSSKLCDPATCHHIWSGYGLPGRIIVRHCERCGTRIVEHH